MGSLACWAFVEMVRGSSLRTWIVVLSSGRLVMVRRPGASQLARLIRVS